MFKIMTKLVRKIKSTGKAPSSTATKRSITKRDKDKKSSKTKEITIKNEVKNTVPDKMLVPLNPSKLQVLNILSVENNPIKRCIFVDGCNVGFAHANHKFFSVEGMQICLEFFQREGHTAIAVVPHTKANNNSNPGLLQSLASQKRVLFAPFDNEFGTCKDTYDDKCILSLAVHYDGAVVSNDNYRDLINSNADWRKVIETRVIPFCFFKHMFMVPRDPYGPGKSSLSDILIKSPV